MSVMKIPDSENVARALFSPRMIKNGEIQPEAFRLRPSIAEDYLESVLMHTLISPKSYRPENRENCAVTVPSLCRLQSEWSSSYFFPFR